MSSPDAGADASTSTTSRAERTVSVERADAVLTIRLNRPDKMNAMDPDLLLCLLEEVLTAAADHTVRAVVITGNGRAFCAGMDLAHAEELKAVERLITTFYNPIVRGIRGMSKPVITAINGAAAGAGMGLALTGDLRVMSEAAFFSCAFITISLVPDTGTTKMLVDAVGYARAFELASSGRRLPAAEALDWGLVNEVVPAAEVVPTALAHAQRLARGPRTGLALTKQLLLAAETHDESTMLDLETRGQVLAVASGECWEGIAAFLEKRPPAYPTTGTPIPRVIPD